MVSSSQDAAISGARSDYQKRRVRFLRRAELGEWTVKLYGIAPQGLMVRGILAVAALHAAARALPSPAVTAQRHGVGFVIAHDAPQLSYALVCWWDDRNEVHERIFSARSDVPENLMPHPSDAIGCVWELSVVDFERRAWITHVLANPDGPNLPGYLAQEYNDDF